MLSPSPFTLGVWSLLALFQARKFRPSSVKKWGYYFSLCAFSLGFIVLPFDSLWVVCQNVRFGYLYPDERWITLGLSLTRNGVFLLISWLGTREIHKLLNWDALYGLLYFVVIFLGWFGLANNPSWTDWTYAWRLGYGGVRTIYAFLISHGLMKFIQALIYFDLWRVKVES